MKRELAMNFIFNVCMCLLSIDGVSNYAFSMVSKRKHLTVEVKIKILDFNKRENVSIRAALSDKFKST